MAERTTMLSTRLTENFVKLFDNYCDKAKDKHGLTKQYVIRIALESYIKNNPIKEAANVKSKK